MKTFRDAAQAIFGLAILAALIFVLVIAFRSVSGGTGAAPAATAGQVTGYPAPAQTQSGYPGPVATPTPGGLPSPTSILDTIGFTPTPALPPLDDSPDQFDPKTYGLPDTIAGYKVLGVVTSENQACVPLGRKTLALQTTDPTAQDSLKNFRQADVMKAMSELGLDLTEWDFSISGPGSTREQLVAGAQAWNKEREKYGCVSSGGPAIEAATPTSPTP